MGHYNELSLDIAADADDLERDGYHEEARIARAMPAQAPAPYKLFGTTAQWIGELASYGIYRRYCLLADWATSPAALAGHTY